jgi:hypothetical protein
MARFFPVRSQCQFDTPGERRFAFATELLSSRGADEDGVPIIVPESTRCRGAFPELIRCESGWQERAASLPASATTRPTAVCSAESVIRIHE